MSDACPRCDGPIGCVECSPAMMRLRTESRRLQREIKKLKEAGPPEPEMPPDLKSLRSENESLKRDLAGMNKSLADACWPADHEKEDLPEDVAELQKLVRANEDKWEDAKRSADRVRSSIRCAYQQVVTDGQACKKGYVFELGVAIDEFMAEWFG